MSWFKRTGPQTPPDGGVCPVTDRAHRMQTGRTENTYDELHEIAESGYRQYCTDCDYSEYIRTYVAPIRSPREYQEALARYQAKYAPPEGWYSE